MSSITKQQYIYLFNTLRPKNIINASSHWDENDRIQDMRSDWSRVLNTLNYKGQRTNFEILRQYVDNLPSNVPPPIPPPNFISDKESISPFFPSSNFIPNEENEEVDNDMEPIPPPFIPPSISPSTIERNQPVNQNFISK
jgi:hypothetical protein